jgi:hypothetical protein
MVCRRLIYEIHFFTCKKKLPKHSAGSRYVKESLWIPDTYRIRSPLLFCGGNVAGMRGGKILTGGMQMNCAGSGIGLQRNFPAAPLLNTPVIFEANEYAYTANDQ